MNRLDILTIFKCITANIQKEIIIPLTISSKEKIIKLRV